MEEEFTTVRLRRELLWKIIELRGKYRLKSPDDVIEMLLKLEDKKK